MQDTTSLMILEAASHLSDSRREAMRGIARAARSAVEHGAIAVAEFDTRSRLDTSSVQFERADLRYVMRFHDWQRAASTACGQRILGLAPGVFNADSAACNELLSTYATAGGAGAMFTLCVMANTGDGGGLHIMFDHPDVCSWPAARLHRLHQLAHHLAAIWRLRDALGSAPREAVRHAAQTPQPRNAIAVDAPAGRALWPALVAGRWSLLDAFTAAGARHVVAHRNPDAAAALRALLPREQLVLHHALAGRSGKWIALEIGRSESAIARVLRTALRKLGAADTAMLAGVQTAEFEPIAGAAAGELAVARLTPAVGGLAELSDAERAIVTGILGGKRVTAIAHERGTSPRTVAHQLGSVYRKLGASSRRELLALFA